MLYAYNKEGYKIQPEPNKEGWCPLCNTPMSPKCGYINRWHWAHKSLKECDVWSEGETEWHLNWKSRFKKEHTEVIIKKDNSKHIADYYNPTTETTVEFQHSSICFRERVSREFFYTSLVWVIHMTKKTVEHQKYDTYWWKFPKKWITTPLTDYKRDINYSKFYFCKPPFYLHFNDNTLLEVRKVMLWGNSVMFNAKKVTIDWFVSMLERNMAEEYFKAITQENTLPKQL